MSDGKIMELPYCASVVVPFWFIMKSVMQECLQAIKELMSTANNYGIEKYIAN